LVLYTSTAARCDKMTLEAAMKGSLSEFPQLQLPNEPEQRDGGYTPVLYPQIIATFGSLNVTQYFTLSPKYLKHISA